MAVESAIELPLGSGQQPAVLRALSQRIARCADFTFVWLS